MVWYLLVLAAIVRADFFDDFGPRANIGDYETKPTYAKSTAAPQPIIHSDFCLGRPDGNYAIKRCSNKYIACTGGITRRQYCPGMLIFDPFLDRCEVASQSPHCTRGRVRPTAPTSPVPTASPRQKPYFSCRQKKDGLYVDRRRPCRPYYFSCSNGEATVMHCPEGLFFDPEMRICDRFSNIPVCCGRPRMITRKPKIVHKPKKVEHVPFDCRGKPSGNYPDPWAKQRPYCSMVYYTCSNGIATKRRCPYTLFYDPRRDVCDRFQNVYTCSGRHYRPTRPPVTTRQPTPPPVPFDCRHRKDGYYVNPRARCSATYYACSGGIARKMKCQYGLAFNPITEQCQQPAVVPICGGRPATKAPYTKAPYTVVTRPPPIDCAHRPNGLYPDPLRRCSRLFYSCSNGHAIRMECPVAMAYDPRTQSCQLASEMYICTGRHTTTARPTRPPKKHRPVPFDCSTHNDGLYPNPRHLCSPFYYACSNGIARRIDCPHGLFYDPHNHVCDVFSEIYVCTGRRKAKTTAPSYRGHVRPSSQFDCHGMPSGLYPEPGKRCGNNFYQCTNDIAYKMTCGHGLFFDPHHKRCDRFQNIYACTGKVQPAYRPKKVTPGYQQQDHYRIPVDCIQLGDGDHPEPGALYGRTYYTCFNGRGVRRQCPKGTFFHVVLKRCESMESLKARYIAMHTPKQSHPPPSYAICSGRPDGSYPFKRCSPEFFTCSGGVSTKHQCPTGLFYDFEQSLCDHPERIPSCGGQRMRYQPRRASPVYKPKSSYDCLVKPDGYYAIRPCSNNYAICSGGLSKEERCPEHLVFSEATKTCDYAYRTPSCQRSHRRSHH